MVNRERELIPRCRARPMEQKARPCAGAIACAMTQQMQTCSGESDMEHSGTSFLAERRARSSLEKAPTRSVTPLPYPARARLRPVALRPTLSDGLPLSCRLSEKTATEPQDAAIGSVWNPLYPLFGTSTGKL